MAQHKKIQHVAHSAASVSVLWTLFSAFAVFDWRDCRRSIGDPNAAPSLTIWGTHFLLIRLALFAWQRERPRPALWLGTGDDPPAPIQGNKWKHKAAEKAAISLWLLSLACFAAAFWPGKPALGATALLLSVGLELNIALTKLADAVLRRKIEHARRP